MRSTNHWPHNWFNTATIKFETGPVLHATEWTPGFKLLKVGTQFAFDYEEKKTKRHRYLDCTDIRVF